MELLLLELILMLQILTRIDFFVVVFLKYDHHSYRKKKQKN